MEKSQLAGYTRDSQRTLHITHLSDYFKTGRIHYTLRFIRLTSMYLVVGISFLAATATT